MHGLMKIQLDNESLDHEFIKNSTTGFQNLVSNINNTDWERIENDSGLSKLDIKRAGEILAQSNSTIACWAMGLTQHRNGVAVIQEVANFSSWEAHR